MSALDLGDGGAPALLLVEGGHHVPGLILRTDHAELLLSAVSVTVWLTMRSSSRVMLLYITPRLAPPRPAPSWAAHFAPSECLFSV